VTDGVSISDSVVGTLLLSTERTLSVSPMDGQGMSLSIFPPRGSDPQPRPQISAKALLAHITVKSGPDRARMPAGVLSMTVCNKPLCSSTSLVNRARSSSARFRSVISWTIE
jgi:hypothetical protein